MLQRWNLFAKRERQRGGGEELFFFIIKKNGHAPHVPGLRDDNVVDWLVALAEAREADFDNHVVVFWASNAWNTTWCEVENVEGGEDWLRLGSARGENFRKQDAKLTEICIELTLLRA
jgi:hypothetical protein